MKRARRASDDCYRCCYRCLAWPRLARPGGVGNRVDRQPKANNPPHLSQQSRALTWLLWLHEEA